MNINSLLQYATLFSVAVGLLGVAIALFVNRQQVNTQIFLALASQYDDLLGSSSAGFWAGLHSENDLPEPSSELNAWMLRYYTHSALIFVLHELGVVPGKLWKLNLPVMERRLGSLVFIREWKLLQNEFEHLPEFASFVNDIQHRKGRKLRENQDRLVPR
jgi:hypothetical protein